MHPCARRLTKDSDARRGTDAQYGSRLMRQRQTARLIAANPAGADFRNKRVQHALVCARANRRHAFALGRAETSAYQRAMFMQQSGTESFDGFMKSMATSNVMSAMEKASPAR